MDITCIKQGKQGHGYLYATNDNLLWGRSRVNSNLMYVSCATENCLGKGQIVMISALRLMACSDGDTVRWTVRPGYLSAGHYFCLNQNSDCPPDCPMNYAN